MLKRTVITVIMLVYLIGGFVLAEWLAGCFYFLLSHARPEGILTETWGLYWTHYSHIPVQKKRLLFAAIGAGTLIYLIPVLAIAKIFGETPRSLHGDARFATSAEITRAGLFADDGIIVGKYRGRFLVFSGQQFVLLAAPTRSGKGVSVVLPNLLSFNGSVVVLDIKLEGFRLTSLYRERHGQKVFLFNPFAEDLKTHRWNPLDAVRRDGHFRVGDILALGQVIYPSDGRDAFWNDQARNLFLGLVLYLTETPDLPCTFAEVLRQSSGKGQGLREYLQTLMKARRDSPHPLSSVCREALERFCGASENTGASILATFNAPLTIFASPVVDAATAASDFDLSRVRSDLMSVYIGIEPGRLADAALLINLFFSQLIELNTRALPQNDPDLRHQCLLILDEFTSVGRIGVLARANAFISGYNLRLLTVVQSLAQLEAVYGEKDARTLATNHALQILFTPREQKDANAYSEMLGFTTERAVSKGRSRPLGGGHGSQSENTSDQRRALMLPQELKELGRDKAIVLLENTKPVRCEKVRYFADPVFIARLRSVGPTLSAATRRTPSQAELGEVAFVGRELSASVPVLDVSVERPSVTSSSSFAAIGEAVEPSRLAIDLLDLPKLDDPENPSDASLEEVVEAFASRLGWADTVTGTATDFKTAMAQFDAFAAEVTGASISPTKAMPAGKRKAKTSPAKPAKSVPSGSGVAAINSITVEEPLI